MYGSAPARSSIDVAEVARFSAIADQWWDPHGKFAPLHRLNPVRLAFIRERALAWFGRPARERRPFAGLRLLDIGCGGGLLCEPMARLGFEVRGVDAAEENVAAARAHAAAVGQSIDYSQGVAENLARATPGAWDVILNMEVIEHVADPTPFLQDCIDLLAPGGMMILATLNRTAMSLLLAKLGAEYLLRWLPAGTHDWRRFVTPAEVAAAVSGRLDLFGETAGVTFDPIASRCRASADLSGNYMMAFTLSSV